MAKQPQKKKASGGKQRAAGKVPEAAPGDVFDDPGPTRALPQAKPAAPVAVPLDGPWDDEAEADDLFRGAGSLLEPAEVAAADVHDDPGPTKALPPAKVLAEIETAQAVARLRGALSPAGKGPKAKAGKKR